MTLLASLKSQTADCHVGLEKSMDVFGKVKTKEDYADLLKSFFTLYEPLESSLAKAVDWRGADWSFDARLKTPLLRDDLHELGVGESAMAGWARCSFVPVPADLGESVGVLYVLEGSTLGGQMISQQFNRTLCITPDHGGKFFHGYGAQTGSHWRAFGQWAEARNAAASGSLEKSAVRGVRKTFEVFAQWLTQ